MPYLHRCSCGGVFLAPDERAQADRVWRICSAHTSAAANTRPCEESFLDALRQLGFERARNREYAVRNADGDLARPPGVVDEVLALKSDLLFGIEAVARVMRSKTTTIPKLSCDNSWWSAMQRNESPSNARNNAVQLHDLGCRSPAVHRCAESTLKRHSFNLRALRGAVIGAQQEADWRQAGCKG